MSQRRVLEDPSDLGTEYLGNVGPDGYDQVVLRGNPEGGTFTAFWLRAGRVLAGMHANDWDAMDPIRRIVGVQRAVAGLDDESVALAQVAATLTEARGQKEIGQKEEAHL